MPFDFGDDPINTEESIGVQCMANKGDLPMDIRWVLNSSPVTAGQNGITIMKMNQRTSSLNINSVEGMHRGLFKCLVSNEAGTAEHSAELRVNGSLLLWSSGYKIEFDDDQLDFIFFKSFPIP